VKEAFKSMREIALPSAVGYVIEGGILAAIEVTPVGWVATVSVAAVEGFITFALEYYINE
jgi:hypothetical protein